PVGEQIGPYWIESRLGAGGMGVVYKARDERLGRLVAIKFLAGSSKTSLDRFRKEARAASALNHPNNCTVHDVGEHVSGPYIVMELVEGPTLAEKLEEGTPEFEYILDVATQVAGGVAAAHEKGIVHRDLKPSNIKIKADGTVKILD